MNTEQRTILYIKSLKRETNYLRLHNLLYSRHDTMYAYFFLKALKIHSFQTLMDFAAASKNSIYGKKALLRKILNTYYGKAPYKLKYSHDQKDGLVGLDSFVHLFQIYL